MKNNLTNTQKEFLKDYKYIRNVVIAGTVGTWKTYAARKLLKKYKTWHEITNSKRSDMAYEITDARIKEELSSGNLRLRRADEWQNSVTCFPLECILKAWIVLIDDLWVADVSDAYIRKLIFMLDYRADRELPTIFTTNLSPLELEEKLDPRIKSRVYRNAYFLEVKWDDLRKAGIEVVK